MISDDKSGWRSQAIQSAPSLREIETWLDPWLNGRSVLEAELMSGGLMNRNLLLRLAGRPAECVLRIYDRDRAACRREVAVLGLIGRDIPVPRVLYADEDGENGPPLAVMSVVDGLSLYTLRTMGDQDGVAAAAHDVGRVLAKIAGFPGPPTPHETVFELVHRFSATPAFDKRVPASTRDRLMRLAERCQPRLDALKSGDLTHGDFNSRNIFVKRTGDAWAVSGILDWEFALDASAFCDIGNFLRYERGDNQRYEPHFSRGLREGGVTLPEDWRVVSRLMDLPALCELLSRTHLPGPVADELVELLGRTIAEHENG